MATSKDKQDHEVVETINEEEFFSRFSPEEAKNNAFDTVIALMESGRYNVDPQLISLAHQQKFIYNLCLKRQLGEADRLDMG